MFELKSKCDLEVIIDSLVNKNLPFQVFAYIEDAYPGFMFGDEPKDHVKVKIVIASQVGTFIFEAHHKSDKDLSKETYKNIIEDLNPIYGDISIDKGSISFKNLED